MGTGSRAAPVNTFRDALGVAMAIAEDYAFANAAVLVEPGGRIHDIGIVEGIGTSIDGLTRWVVAALGGAAAARQGRRSPPLRVLLISVRPFEVDTIRESDLRRYREASWAVANTGADLLDWIETDGDLFRSYAYTTCPGVAWPDDPPQDRQDDAS
ncbi:MAG: hypothetical protein AAF547_14670 [Actinomycetota bacterium]